jgi:predicted dehydrogenase
LGRTYARLIADREDLCIAVVVSPPSEANKAFASQIGCAHVTDINDAFQRFTCEAALICSPNSFHFDQTLACITHGIPTLVEKPLTDSLETARLLCDHVAEQNARVLVGHHRHYNPLLKAAWEVLRSADFGDLICVQGSALFLKPDDYFTVSPWRTRPGSGPILTNLIHDIGVLRYLCGEITAVQARTVQSRRGHAAEDTAAIVFEFEGGALGTFVLSDHAASDKSWEMTSGENASYPHYPDQNCYHFAGTHGSLDFPSLRLRTYAGQKDRSWMEPFANRQMVVAHRDPLVAQLDHFVDVILGKSQPYIPVSEGYANLRVLDAIFRSAAARAEIQVSAV